MHKDISPSSDRPAELVAPPDRPATESHLFGSCSVLQKYPSSLGFDPRNKFLGFEEVCPDADRRLLECFHCQQSARVDGDVRRPVLHSLRR